MMGWDGAGCILWVIEGRVEAGSGKREAGIPLLWLIEVPALRLVHFSLSSVVLLANLEISWL